MRATHRKRDRIVHRALSRALARDGYSFLPLDRRRCIPIKFPFTRQAAAAALERDAFLHRGAG